MRPISRNVFRPAPNVDSALVRAAPHRRRRAAPAVARARARRVRAPAQGARRARSSWPAGRRGVREAARDGARGAWATRPTRAPSARARGVRRSSRASWSELRSEARDARAGEAQPLPLRRRRAAPTACTRSARCSSRSRSPTSVDAGARRPGSDEVVCPGVAGPNLAAAALAALPRALRLGRAAGAGHDREAHPGRGGPRRRLGRRGRGAAPGARRPRACDPRAARAAPTSRCRSAPTCLAARAAARARDRRRRAIEELERGRSIGPCC